jgi:gliding motility-associated-like protein
MVETPSGDFVMVGINTSFFPLYGNIVYMDNTGLPLWARGYTAGFATTFNDIKNVPGGGFIVCGSSDANGAILMRLDNAGTIIWSRRYALPNRPSGNASFEYFNSVIPTSDGGFVAAGGVDYFWDGVSPNSVDTASPYAVKVDANGVIEWSRVWTISVPNPDEHYFNDVAETADGFVFVGLSSEGSGTLNSDGDYPRNGLVVKTNKATGATTFINRFGAGNTNSESINCAITLSNGNVLIAGQDGVHAPFARIAGTGSTFSQQYGRRLNGATFPLKSYIINDVAENSDGNYSFISTYMAGLFPIPTSAITKINISSNAIMVDRSYGTTGGLATILPEGGLATDQGYYYTMTDQQFSGFNYQVIRTDAAGLINVAGSDCSPSSTSASTNSYTYSPQTVTNNQFANLATSGTFSPVILNLSPTNVIHCLNIVCNPPSAPTTVTATPNPICAGQSTTITASGGGAGNTYNVYDAPTGGTNLGATPLVVTPPTTTTYYVETVDGSDPSCVSTTRTAVTVTVDPAPTVTVTPSAPAICTGGSVSLTASGATTYTWSPSAGLSATTGATVTANPATTTTYTVEGIAGPGCPGTTTVTVTVNPLPTITATPSAPAICAGNSVSITASGASTYTWSPGTGLSGTTGATVTANPATTTTYTITGVDANSCQNTTTVQVTVNPIPTATASASPSTVCVGGTINLSSSGGTSYSWSGPNTYSSTTQNPTITNATLAESGTYTVTVTDGNGCEATANTTVTVSNGATLAASVISNVSCNGGSNGSAQVSPSGTPGPYTYSWSPSGGTGATAQNLSAGTYTVTVTDGNGCQSQESVTITEPSPINLSISSTASSCVSPTGSATVVASGGAGNFTYIWSPSGGTGATASNIGAGPYTVTVTDGNGCTETASVTVNTVNGPDVVIASSNNVSCFGLSDGSATAIASNGTPGYTYSWSPSGGNNAVATGLSAGNYTIEVVDAAGCTAFATVTITQPQQIIITGVVTDAACGSLDGAITANAVGGTGPLTYVWQPGNIAGQTISNLSGGTYTVTVSDGTCSESAPFTVNVTGSLSVDINPPFAVINQGDEVDLTVTVNPNIAGSTYSWNPTTDLSCSSCPNPTASPNETTTYTVTVTSPDGCVGTASTLITVEMVCGDIFMPTIFSPNDDGLNDELCLLGGCIEKMELSIYNRWGELVFQTDSQDNCWDGTFKGQRMNTAAFVYVLYVKLLNGEEIQQKGNINLVR